MIEIALAVASLLLALPPTVLFLRNLPLYRPLPPADPEPDQRPRLSVLIPARDEEGSIEGAVRSALDDSSVDVEVRVLDDRSTDTTAERVRAIADHDARVHLHDGQQLPEGWCGKQHACAQLARRSTRELLVFMDADVRLEPDGLARMESFLRESRADLVSGFPRQETGTLLEKLLIPLIHFLLLGFLPLRRMRRSGHPAYAAGCGQLVLVRREAYEAVGGHGAVRGSLHDGLTLPRAFRRAGRSTDLFDATDVARCRMYRSFAETWSGLAKNATEGLAAPRSIVPATLLLFGGQVLPVLLLALASTLRPGPARIAGLAAGVSFLPRLVAIRRFDQSPLGALLHPLGVLVLLSIQWFAAGRALLGLPARWKGRAYRGPQPVTRDAGGT